MHQLRSETMPGWQESTHGITSDCDTTTCPVPGASLYGQLDATGAARWSAYAENMAKPCDQASYGKYAARHNPAVYYTSLPDCREHDVNFRQLRPALDGDTLPAFVFITPNMCDSMHSCGVATGDAWLWHVVKRLAASAAWQVEGSSQPH